MALRQQGTLREQFNRAGRYETLVRTETETEDAGSFGHYRPGGLVSKFASMALVAPSAPVPADTGRKKPLEVNATAFKM